MQPTLGQEGVQACGGGVAWPGTEAVERGAHCQGHTGMGDTMDTKGQTRSRGQGEPREVSGQGGDNALTRRAHMGYLSGRVWVLCFSPLWGHPGGLDANADFQAHP